MPQVSFRELEPEVLSAAPACPIPTIIRELRNAARELCEKTSCYRYAVSDEVVVENIRDVELFLPSETVLVRPMSITLDNRPLRFTTPKLLDADDPDWRILKGPPTHVMRSTESQSALLLFPLPERSYAAPGLAGEVALKPSRAATQVDSLFLENYQTVVVSGALARILMIKSGTWYDARLAGHYKSEFEHELNSAAAFGGADDIAKNTLVRYGGI